MSWSSLKASRVIGVDPGLGTTGIGIIECDTAKQICMLHYQTISPDRKLPLHKRLLIIQNGVSDLIATFQPDALAVEETFYHKNVKSALTLGQARAAVLLAAAAAEIDVMELSAKTVKQSVVGTGGAAKQQVAAMVASILKLPEPPNSLDACDALAIALAALNRSHLPEAMYS
jgi:crossover junction endodeoxyribonuclease RuvC